MKQCYAINIKSIELIFGTFPLLLRHFKYIFKSHGTQIYHIKQDRDHCLMKVYQPSHTDLYCSRMQWLTHCGLELPHGDIELCQRWLR